MSGAMRSHGKPFCAVCQREIDRYIRRDFDDTDCLQEVIGVQGYGSAASAAAGLMPSATVRAWA